ANVSRLGEGDELVAPVRPRAVQLLREERQRIFRLVAVTRHALAAAVELPHPWEGGGWWVVGGGCRFTLHPPPSTLHDLVGAVGRNQVRVGLIVAPGEGVGAPVHALEVQ